MSLDIVTLVVTQVHANIRAKPEQTKKARKKPADAPKHFLTPKITY